MFGKYIDTISANIITILNEGNENASNLMLEFFKLIDANYSELFEDYNRISKMRTEDSELFNESISEVIYSNRVKKFDLKLLENFITDNGLDTEVEPTKFNQLLDNAIFENVNTSEIKTIKEELDKLRKSDVNITLMGEGKVAYNVILDSKVTRLSEEYNVDSNIIKALLENDKPKLKESFDNLLGNVLEKLTEEAFNETSDLETFNLVKESKNQLLSMKSIEEPDINHFEKLFMLNGSNEGNS